MALRTPAGTVEKMWIRATMLGLLFAVVTPLTASAQSDTDEEARNLFDAGEAAFEDGRYETALERFEEALELSGRPELHFNIGTTAERLRQDPKALESYRRYLEEVPDAENRNAVEARIRILEEANINPPPPPQETDTSNDGSTSSGRVLTWVFGASALVFGGLALTSWLVGDGELDSLNETCMTGCSQMVIDSSSVRTWDILTNVGLGLSVVSAALAVTFFFVEGSDESEELSLRIGPTGIQAIGSF